MGRGPTPIELERPEEIGRDGPDLRDEVEHKAPENPSYVPPAGRQGSHDRPHRRRGYGRHHHYYGCGHYGYGYNYGYGYYDPYDYYSPYLPRFYWGLGHWWPNYYRAPEIGPYGGGGGGSSSSYLELGRGALDLDLRPETAEIYVDGVYVGEADQYDGYPTYLWLDEGTYELAFYREGYETIFRQYTIHPGVTIKVDDRMRRGEAIPPAGPPQVEERPPAAHDGGGRIAIAATPGDAAVYLDGHFVGTAGEIADLGSGLIVEPGDHVIEIIRPGYESQRVPVSVAAGERIDVELNLRNPP